VRYQIGWGRYTGAELLQGGQWAFDGIFTGTKLITTLSLAVSRVAYPTKGFFKELLGLLYLVGWGVV